MRAWYEDKRSSVDGHSSVERTCVRSAGAYTVLVLILNLDLTSGPLAQLRSTFTSSTQSGEIDLITQTRHTLPGPASFIAYAHNETRLVVALADGSLAVYYAQSLLNNTPANPVHIFPGTAGASFRKLAPNPGDMSELVAVLRDVGERTDAVAVEVFDIRNMRSVCGWRGGATPNTRPTAMSWSAKGKLIALGLASGDIEAFSPTAPSAAKTVVPKVQALNEGTIISTTWLSNTEYYNVYTPPGPPSPDAEHTHFVALFDPKTNVSVEVKVNPPALPFPGLRAPNQFIVLFRSWDSARILLFVGDSASSDIGVLGAIGAIGTPLHAHWTNLSLEETSQPTVPLDKDMNDTVLVGLEVDLTNQEPYRYTGPSGEETDVPPPPVLYAYASDGTLTGWQVVNTKGVAYPGMVTPSEVSAGGMDAEPTTNTPPPLAVHAPAMEISTSFGSSSPVTASPMAATPSAGANPSGFGGFGAFAGGANKFGQSAFGFGGNAASGTPSAPALASPMPSQRPPSPEEATMDSDNDAGAGFGGLSLGGGGNDDANKSKTSSVFGSFGSAPTTGAQPTSTFGSSSGGLKPATGFGVFGNQGSSAFSAPSAFSNASASSPPSGGAFSTLKPATGFGAFASQSASAFGSTSAFSPPASTAGSSPLAQSAAKPASAFGGSAFGQPSTPPKPAFGQSSTLGQPAFGQTSTPGQPAFGQTSFGKPAFGQPAFGQSAFGKPILGQSSFGQPTSDAGQAATATGGGFSAFAQAGPSDFGAAKASTSEGQSSATAEAAKTEAKSPPAFGQSSFGQSGFSQTDFGQAASPFGAANKPATFVSSGFGAFAQAGLSGLGATATKPDAKPAWATKPSDQPTTPKEEANPVFAPPTPSSALQTPPRASPTPSSTPRPLQTPEKPSEGSTSASTTPVSTTSVSSSSASATSQIPEPPLTSESPSRPVGGAFGQLRASSFGFGKLDSGFGAFGGGVADTSSPFFKAVTKPMETPTKPAFAAGTTPLAASPPSAGTDASKLTFGAPSPLGGGRSVFGLPSSPSSKATTTPTSTPPSRGGFAAFSSNKSPFGTTSSGSKSFSEMLRDKTGQELIQPIKPPTIPDKKKPVSAFANLPKVSEKAKEGTSSGADDDDDDAISFGDEDEHDDGASFLSGSEPDVDGSEDDGADETWHPEEEAREQEDEGEDEEEEEEDDDDDDDDDDEDEEEDAEGIQESSPTKTPTDDNAPTTEVADEAKDSELPSPLDHAGPAAMPERKSPPAAVSQREGSTTPPGSPATMKAASAPPAPQRSLAPPPVVASSGPSLNLPRGTTRPIRSSPLASKPITGDDDSSEGGQSPPGTPPSTLKSKQPSEAQGLQASRPKTPPLLSTLKSAPIPTVVPFSLAQSSKAAPADSAKSLPLAPNQPSPFTPGAMSSPAPPPAIPTVTPPKPGVFSLSPLTSSLAPKAIGPAQPLGIGTPALSPSTATGIPSPVVSQPTAPPQPGARTVALPQSPAGQLPAITDLQSECEFLVKYLAAEFTRLLPLTQLAARRRTEMYKTGLNLANLDEANNWRISDLPRLEQLMITAENDLAHVKEYIQSYISMIQAVESQLLKASTRKEEIIRFSKASKDPDFARMLKARTLGPEHLEAQSQLRREIRAVRERLQQLEDHMQEAKKKLAHMKSGKAAIRPPSLSLINGTCNHLEEAIEQNEDVIEELSKRTSRLSLELAPRRSKWEQRITDDDSKRHVETTPNFAVSTAAALNAEMSANKLKRALLAARKEPLLNTQASSKMPVAQDYALLPEVKTEPETPPPSSTYPRLSYSCVTDVSADMQPNRMMLSRQAVTNTPLPDVDGRRAGNSTRSLYI
ncbi:hypothetical protein DAEQUDRAFT_171504 [Daedalea quercina L-15889]|uniref:Nucleoporin Nup159/Nup146 N-terminal domain-containing protein n=1 Tax=Daedalea quercina L-15889 TaxID=1314783 RepID=A0A165RKQ0_9APHY|nr:hypothetical protein DAEQUDRAFT_171504 [Daedalea quercina L-15889]